MRRRFASNALDVVIFLSVCGYSVSKPLVTVDGVELFGALPQGNPVKTEIDSDGKPIFSYLLTSDRYLRITSLKGKVYRVEGDTLRVGKNTYTTGSTTETLEPLVASYVSQRQLEPIGDSYACYEQTYRLAGKTVRVIVIDGRIYSFILSLD